MDMRMLLVSSVLLFLPQTLATTSPNLTAGCRTGTADECRKALFVPGHTLLGAGFNILTMTPKSSFLLDLQLVNKMCILCNNPFHNNVLQKLPMAMVDWRPHTSCSRNIASSIHQSSISLANEGSSAVSNDWKVGLQVPISSANVKISVGGSHSKMAKFAESKSTSDKYSFLSHKMECTYYSFGLSKKPVLTSHFKASLKQLPPAYNFRTKTAYRHLISRYGTHYITQAEVGGRLKDVTAVRTCEVAMNSMTMDEVKDCLSLEAELSANVPKSPSINAALKHCSQKAKQSKQGNSYSQTFRDRESEVIGGNITFDLLAGKNNPRGFDKWMESLKYYPDLVSYALEPIHNLVRFKGSIKDNLVKAINDYLKENARMKKCSCSRKSYGEDCSCTCSPTKHINSDCCPTNRGEAKLHVTIRRAYGLWGDYITKTDAYVKITFGSIKDSTPTIWNNNNPQWNKRFDFDIVQLSSNMKMSIEVWDEDNKYDDDLLGKCEITVSSGESSNICYLKHGKLTYSVSAKCSPYLKGRYCQDYSPSSK